MCYAHCAFPQINQIKPLTARKRLNRYSFPVVKILTSRRYAKKKLEIVAKAAKKVKSFYLSHRSGKKESLVVGKFICPSLPKWYFKTSQT